MRVLLLYLASPSHSNKTAAVSQPGIGPGCCMPGVRLNDHGRPATRIVPQCDIGQCVAVRPGWRHERYALSSRVVPERRFVHRVQRCARAPRPVEFLPSGSKRLSSRRLARPRARQKSGHRLVLSRPRPVHSPKEKTIGRSCVCQPVAGGS
jgi:hypothetical protein